MIEKPNKPLTIFIYAALTFSIVAIYWQTRNFDFITLDDMTYVYENPHVTTGISFDNIVWAFKSALSANWHPLTWLSLMLDCQLFGPDPGRIHLVNVLFHIANTLLLFVIFKKMTGFLWPSAFVAAAFALHPMHVESVAWVAERKDVLSTFFMLLALAAYVSYVRNGSMLRYGLTVLLFVLGLLSKPMLVTLPFLLLLLDYWPLDRFSTPNIKTSQKSRKPAATVDNRRIAFKIIVEKIPFFLLSAASSVMTFIMQRKGGAMINIAAFTLPDRFANALLSYMRYLGKMLWPINMAVFYPFDTASMALWQIIFAALLLLGISVLVIIFGRKRKYLPVGWFWFLGTLIPVIGLIQVGEQSMADRYTYIPYIGLFIITAWGMPELLSNWRSRLMVLGFSMFVVLISLAILSYQQAGYWKNSFTLFSHAIEVTKNNYVAQGGLGEDLRKQGKTSVAIEHLTKAIEIKPDYSDAILNLGCALVDQGNTTEAIKYFKKSLQLKPNFAKAHYNFGVALQKQGNLDEAISHYKDALSIMPDFPNAHYNLAVALQTQAKLDEAIAHYTQAITLKPDLAEARFNLANIFVSQGRINEALDQLRAILLIKPDWPAAMSNTAWLIATHPEIKNRNVDEAIQLARRACELTNFSDPMSMGALAGAYAATGTFDKAIDTAKSAINLAQAANQPQMKKMFEYQLSFYNQHKPFIESARPPSYDRK